MMDIKYDTRHGEPGSRCGVLCFFLKKPTPVTRAGHTLPKVYNRMGNEMSCPGIGKPLEVESCCSARDAKAERPSAFGVSFASLPDPAEQCQLQDAEAPERWGGADTRASFVR